MQIRNKQPLTVLALLLASLPLSLLAQPADHAGRAAGDALLAATPERVPFQLAAKSDDLPLSRDSLFGTDEPAAKPAAKPVAAPGRPGKRTAAQSRRPVWDRYASRRCARRRTAA
ncbi:MAG: hypothetical protein J5W83_08695 [Candidatus Accumulibacter sp.]|uniref:hypothetical protein n=1 Tax=Accumulibacter sp. TaxID=2053492 RepID=UPI001B21C587|nr:hypothetical protein [Accumulibacter sp.]MBO3702606.1 hypothetical protein [Accumulibacter sp.]